MKIKKTIALVCLCGAAALVSQSAMADGIKIRGGVTSNDYTLEDTPYNSSPYTVAKSTYSGTNLGLTWMMSDTAYLDFATSNGSGTYDRIYSNRAPVQSDFTRSDNAIILGAYIPNAGGSTGNVYVGWKDGKTTLGRALNYSTPTSFDFTASGLVFGGGIGIPAVGGTIGLSGGMGIMSGKLVKTTTTTSTLSADYTFGFSYGISYSYAFTPNFGISADYKGNLYNYTFDSGLTTQETINETFTTKGASLYLKF
jgi:hypothetical protein